jgi:hypothetical protein
VCVRHVCRRGEVRDLHQRIRRGLNVNHPRIRANGLLEFMNVGLVYRGGGDTPSFEDLCEERHCRSIVVALAYHVISRLQLADDGCKDRAHAGTRDQSSLPFLERRDGCFNERMSRIPVACVELARLDANSYLGEVFGGL